VVVELETVEVVQVETVVVADLAFGVGYLMDRFLADTVVVVAVASLHNLDNSVVVAQGSPFVTRLSTHSSLWGK